MAFKMELYKGGELHYRAARQRRYFVGAFVLCAAQSPSCACGAQITTQ